MLIPGTARSDADTLRASHLELRPRRAASNCWSDNYDPVAVSAQVWTMMQRVLTRYLRTLGRRLLPGARECARMAIHPCLLAAIPTGSAAYSGLAELAALLAGQPIHSDPPGFCTLGLAA